MTIREVRIHKLRAPLKERFGWSLGWTSHRVATLVEVVLDDGRSGWGDGTFGGDRLLRHPELVIGRSPFDAEAIYESLREEPVLQRRRGPQSCGGLDVALWDLQGQILGLPAHRLLGLKQRDRVEPYCTALYRKDWPDLVEGLAEEAREWKRRGFRVMKMKVGYGEEIDVRNVRAVRDAIGADTGLAVDANCAYESGRAVALGRRLEEFDLKWWEEPVLADDLDGYRRLRESLRIPLAAGETWPVDDLIRHYVQPRLVDILQPEIEIVGLTGARRLTQACWWNRVRLIPHNWGTAVRTAAILHWMATVPPLTEGLCEQGAMFEFDQTESPFRDAVVTQPIALGPDGHIAVPETPGLGVEVVREAVAEYRVEEIRVA